MLAGVASQSASGIPGGGLLITGGLCLRYNRESSCRQGFSRAEVLVEPSRPLNGTTLYDAKRWSSFRCRLTGRSSRNRASRSLVIHPCDSTAWWISALLRLWIRCGPPISPTSRCIKASSALVTIVDLFSRNILNCKVVQECIACCCCDLGGFSVGGTDGLIAPSIRKAL
jgi:hypothetical protein